MATLNLLNLRKVVYINYHRNPNILQMSVMTNVKKPRLQKYMSSHLVHQTWSVSFLLTLPSILVLKFVQMCCLFVNLLSVTSGVFDLLFQHSLFRYILNKNRHILYKKKQVHYQIKKNLLIFVWVFDISLINYFNWVYHDVDL